MLYVSMVTGAFMGSGEPAVANNIINQTHRIQAWDFTLCDLPDLTQGLCLSHHYCTVLRVVYS